MQQDFLLTFPEGYKMIHFEYTRARNNYICCTEIMPVQTKFITFMTNLHYNYEKTSA